MRRFRPGMPAGLASVIALLTFAVLWPARMERPRWELVSERRINSFQFSPDGQTMFVDQDDRTSLYDVESGALRTALDQCVYLEVFPGGTRWVSWDGDGYSIRDVDRGRVLETLPKLPDGRLVFSADRRLLAFNGHDVYDALTRERVMGFPQLKGVREVIGNLVAFAAEPKVQGQDYQFTFYELATGKRLATLPIGFIWGYDLTPDRHYVLAWPRVTPSRRPVVRLDLHTGAFQEYPFLKGTWIAISPNGDVVAETLAHPMIPSFLQIWDALKGEIWSVALVELTSQRKLGTVPGREAKFAPDGRTFAVLSEDFITIQLWDFPLRTAWLLRLGLAAAVGLASWPLWRWLRRPRRRE